MFFYTLHTMIPREHYFPSLKEELTKHCFAEGNGTPLVNHRGKETTGWKSLFDILKEAGCPDIVIFRFLTDKGTWQAGFFRQFENINPYDIPLKQLETISVEATTHLLAAGQYSLDGSFEHGYNDHRQDHVNRVAMSAKNLLRMAHQPEHVQRRGMLMAHHHDTFNLLSRSLHQHGAGLILAKIFPKIAENQTDFEYIDRGMHLHTESVAAEVFATFHETYPNQKKYYEKLLEEVGPEALALIIADKTDLRPERAMNTKGLSAEGIKNDPHFLLNLVAMTTKFGISEGRKKMFWNVSFSPDAIFSLAADRRTQKIIADNQDALPNLESWFSSFWNLYFDRLKLVATSTFALFPSVQEMVLVISDCSNAEEVPKHHKIIITRELAETQLDEYRALYTSTKAA